jgi:tellurite resistance protein TerC
VRCIPNAIQSHFVVREGGKWLATPLLLVLMVIEATDVVFAVDSIPAIFAITRDPFIVYTSNIFAILGLRALFFLLAGAIGNLHYLKTGLALVLSFVGVKMLVTDVYKIPIAVSLAVVVCLIGGAIVASLLRSRFLPVSETPLAGQDSGGSAHSKEVQTIPIPASETTDLPCESYLPR